MDVNETLRKYEGWLHKIASQLSSPSESIHDDLVQEGRIAMWRALETHDPAKGSLPAWLTIHAKRRMIEIVTGKRFEGQPKRQHGRYPVADPRLVGSIDAPTHMRSQNPLRAGTSRALRDDTAEHAIEHAEMAYHRGEIAAARRHLTPAQQRYVAARFYAQLTDREMVLAGVFSYNPHALWTSAKNGARGKLATELAHLKESEG